MHGQERPLVYFLCVGNAMRSQMAEAFLRHHAGGRFEAASAGTHPFGQVMPEVVEVMRERGIDIAHHTSDPIDPDIVSRCVHVIDLGGRGRDRIPSAFADRYAHWRIEDPYGLGMEGLRETRDRIERRVLRFIEEFDRP